MQTKLLPWADRDPEQESTEELVLTQEGSLLGAMPYHSITDLPTGDSDSLAIKVTNPPLSYSHLSGSEPESYGVEHTSISDDKFGGKYNTLCMEAQPFFLT
ncbi:MAG: hypothetical protein A3F67_08380 [Verrucomicrobia bacterium RIFCSPHIGHO2_12_FULL_41_10]|nr:MAG: hypothetical protein A3F67_08380 [Verrucomicrobia bacterium RIFCSPHIGHO2_12_FULL_41_10]